MKKFKALFVPGLIVMMCLSLFGQEPRGGGGQGAPGGDAGARGAGGQSGGGGRGRGRGAAPVPPPTGPVADATNAIVAAINGQDATFFRTALNQDAINGGRGRSRSVFRPMFGRCG